MRTRLGLFLLIALALVTQAAAQGSEGVLFVETSRFGGNESTSTIRIAGDRIRVESSNAGDAQVFLYRADQQAMYMINPSGRSYQQITRQDIDRLGDQMAQMRAMIEEQLANVPPEQRAMVERMMRGQMANMPGAQSAEPVVYSRVSTGETVGNWTCDRYEGVRGGEKVQEVCATDWRNIDLTEADFRVFQELGEFFEGLASQFDFDFYQVGVDADASEEGAFPGVPVSRTSYTDGQVSSTHEITEISRQSFDGALFEVPDGYRQEESPFAELDN